MVPAGIIQLSHAIVIGHLELAAITPNSEPRSTIIRSERSIGSTPATAIKLEEITRYSCDVQVNEPGRHDSSDTLALFGCRDGERPE